MRADIEKYFPAGIDRRQEIKWIVIGLSASFIYSLEFFIFLSNRYYSLFTMRGKKLVLTEGAVMPDFVEVLGSSLTGFWLVALCMVALFAYHYVYHYQGSKSIYLMKRLPNRWELWRRCVALPALSAAAALCLAGLLLLIYLGIYLLVTPKTCLAPGQWQKIWNTYLGE